MGLDAAIIGLACEVQERVDELLAEPGPERERLLPVLLRLWAAHRRGSLGALLMHATVRIGWDYEWTEGD